MSSRDEEDLLERLTLQAANDGEALISAARTLFCLLVLGRFLTLPDALAGGMKFAIEVVLLGAASLISAGSVRRARRGLFRAPGLIAWSVADAGICFGSLLSNVLWPDERYLGLLRMPDVAVLLPIIFVSALRLTPSATLASVAATLASYLALVAIDRQLNGARIAYGSNEETMLLLLVVAVGVASWMAAFGARVLVRRAARESVQLERARRRLDTLLREHHDVRTLLSTARMSLQLARRQSEAQARVEHLNVAEDAMGELADFVESVKARAFAELALLDGPTAADVEGAVASACAVARRRFPNTRIDVAVLPMRAQIVGGNRSLLQVVFNLLANACEGAGLQRARTVRLGASPVDEFLSLRVEDDGPGFLPELLAAGAEALPSTKPGGSGLGLMLVRELVVASGGTLELANRDGGGAVVTLRLRAVPAAER